MRFALHLPILPYINASICTSTLFDLIAGPTGTTPSIPQESSQVPDVVVMEKKKRKSEEISTDGGDVKRPRISGESFQSSDSNDGGNISILSCLLKTR